MTVFENFLADRARPKEELFKFCKRWMIVFCMQIKSGIFKGPIFIDFGFLIDITPKVMSRYSLIFNVGRAWPKENVTTFGEKSRS